MEQTKEFIAQQISNSEKVVESMIEFNSAVLKGNETIATALYENYISNIASLFENAKSLNNSKDLPDFYKTASSNFAESAERYSQQGKSVMEVSGKVFKEVGEAGRTAYSKGFTAGL